MKTLRPAPKIAMGKAKRAIAEEQIKNTVLREALQKYAWSHGELGGWYCSACGENKGSEHKKDCGVQKALRSGRASMESNLEEPIGLNEALAPWKDADTESGNSSEEKLKLFVWVDPHEVFYGNSILIAVAHNEEEARRVSVQGKCYLCGKSERPLEVVVELGPPTRVIDCPGSEWYEWEE